MTALITLPTDPANIPGVESVTAKKGELVVREDGMSRNLMLVVSAS